METRPGRLYRRYPTIPFSLTKKRKRGTGSIGAFQQAVVTRKEASQTCCLAAGAEEGALPALIAYGLPMSPLGP